MLCSSCDHRLCSLCVDVRSGSAPYVARAWQGAHARIIVGQFTSAGGVGSSTDLGCGEWHVLIEAHNWHTRRVRSQVGLGWCETKRG